MAPTIYSEKKRQVRSSLSLKDMRRLTRGSQHPHPDLPTTSSIVNYVAKGLAPSSLRHGTPSHFPSPGQKCDCSASDSLVTMQSSDHDEMHSMSSANCCIEEEELIRERTHPAARTGFNAPPLREKQIAVRSLNSAKMEHNSQTYSDICEIKNAEGLLAIAIKTIILVKRNQMLQHRLTQLQVETTEFIQSVLANPENRHFREKIQLKRQKTKKM